MIWEGERAEISETDPRWLLFLLPLLLRCRFSKKKTKKPQPALFSASPVIKCELLSCAINVRQHIVKFHTAALLSAPELLNANYKVRQLLKINVLKWGWGGGGVALKAALSPDRCF